MTTFWLALAALTAVALSFLMLPLLRGRQAGSGSHAARNIALYREQFAELERDLRNGLLAQEQYDESRHELERRMLTDSETRDPLVLAASGRNRMLAAALLVMLPAAAVPLYLKLGSPQAVVRQDQAAPAMEAAHGTGQQQFEQMVEKLAQRLRDKTPADAAGWQLLASSYAQLGRFAEAASAFDTAARLQPGDAQLLADFADVQAMANDQRFDGKPDELIRQALTIDPNHPKALMLAGTSAVKRGDLAGALARWEALLRVLPPDSDDARTVAADIAEARRILKLGPAAEAPLDNLANFSRPAEAPPAGTAANASVSGTVSLSPALAAKAAPGDRLRVFARAANGPRMPLAIVEAQVKDLPFKFTLTDAMAMASEMKLSSFPEVVVVARTTKSGNAQASSGDLQGMSGAVKVGSNDLRIVIDSVVP